MAKKQVLGIDIGYDQIKLALVDNGAVTATAMAQMPENLLKEGRFTSPELMASLIRDTMDKNGIKATQAAVVLPNETVYVKNVDMPMMSEEQLTFNLPYEFNDYITGEVKDYLFDYAVLDTEEDSEDDEQNDAFAAPAEDAAPGEDGGEGAEAAEDEENVIGGQTLHLMAAGVEKAVVEDIQNMLRKAALRLVKTSPALCTYISLIREMGTEKLPESGEYGILDLGYHGINMYMYKGDQHVATREFDVGLSSLEDIVADKYGVERHLARTYIFSNFENCLASEECINYYDNIAVELMRAINFYEFSNQGSSLDDLWICGGGAVNEPLLRTIYETLELNLHPAYELLPGGDSIDQSNNFVQAIGVTLEI